MFTALLSGIVSWLTQKFLGLFGKSDAQKLAGLQAKSNTDDSLIKGLEEKDAIIQKTDAMPASDVRERLREFNR